jgi:hypothetical protein
VYHPLHTLDFIWFGLGATTNAVILGKMQVQIWNFLCIFCVRQNIYSVVGFGALIQGFDSGVRSGGWIRRLARIRHAPYMDSFAVQCGMHKIYTNNSR